MCWRVRSPVASTRQRRCPSPAPFQAGVTASGAENQAARAALFLCEERPMPSSVISSFTYEPERQRLVVTFVTGRIYEYADVPPEVARNFRASFSKGVFF